MPQKGSVGFNHERGRNSRTPQQKANSTQQQGDKNDLSRSDETKEAEMEEHHMNNKESPKQEYNKVDDPNEYEKTNTDTRRRIPRRSKAHPVVEEDTKAPTPGPDPVREDSHISIASDVETYSPNPVQENSLENVDLSDAETCSPDPVRQDSRGSVASDVETHGPDAALDDSRGSVASDVETQRPDAALEDSRGSGASDVETHGPDSVPEDSRGSVASDVETHGPDSSSIQKDSEGTVTPHVEKHGQYPPSVRGDSHGSVTSASLGFSNGSGQIQKIHPQYSGSELLNGRISRSSHKVIQTAKANYKLYVQIETLLDNRDVKQTFFYKISCSIRKSMVKEM